MTEERVELVVIFDKEAGSPAHRFNFLAPGVAEFFRLEHPLEVRPQDEPAVSEASDDENEEGDEVVAAETDAASALTASASSASELAVVEHGSLKKTGISLPVPLEQVLRELLLQPGPSITYAGIEDSLTDAGYVLDNAFHEYEWLIEALTQAGKLVVDLLPAVTAPSKRSGDSAEVAPVPSAVEELLRSRDVYYEFGRAPLLRPAEERRLLEAVAMGRRASDLLLEHHDRLDIFEQVAFEKQIALGRQAFDQLVMANTRWVAKIVISFDVGREHLYFEDMMQEGLIGLMRAIELFDTNANARLTTYATWWIRQAIGRAIAEQDRLIRVPVHRFDLINRYQKAKRRLEQTLSGTELELAIAVELQKLSPNDHSQLLRKLNNPDQRRAQFEKQIHAIHRMITFLEIDAERKHVASFDDPVGADGDTTLEEFLPANLDHEQPEVALARADLRSALSNSMESLSERSIYVLMHRFGWDDGVEETLEDIGYSLGVTRERIRQIEAKAINKLRNPLRVKQLVDYMEGWKLLALQEARRVDDKRRLPDAKAELQVATKCVTTPKTAASLAREARLLKHQKRRERDPASIWGCGSVP